MMIIFSLSLKNHSLKYNGNVPYRGAVNMVNVLS